MGLPFGMITNTQSIVLRSIKYGETSLISTHFTRQFGIQAYIIKGIRQSAAKGRSSRAGLLQAGMLLDITAWHHAQAGLQRLKEFSPAFLYQRVHQEVIKNCIAIFSTEVLLRLLPEGAPIPELFDFSMEYFKQLDAETNERVANYPLFFLLQCGRYLGYELAGKWQESTPYLNLMEGGFSIQAPISGTNVTTQDAHALAALMLVRNFEDIPLASMNGAMRLRLIEWFIEFLQTHTDHMQAIRSLEVLQTVLHHI